MSRGFRFVLPGCFLILLCVLLTGCASKELGDVEYGKRVGLSVGRSVSGTTVFADMFQSAGCRVRSATTLGRVVDNADVVVWFPDRFRPPEKPARDHLEDWLQSEKGRILIYVGRDFDAERIYWESVVDSAPLDQKIELRKRQAKAEAKYASLRSGFPSDEDCGWFKLDRTKPTRQIESVSGRIGKGLDPAKADMQLSTRYLISDEIRDLKNKSWRGSAKMETLLRSDGDMLVGKITRTSWKRSKLIVVANGSWLLNLPLVNHEHRKLAARLIRECGGSGKKVVFLESGPTEPRISGKGSNQHHGLEAFTVWPLNCILMHLAGLGLVLCFSMFPIFGRPRELEGNTISDFGKHIRAIGSLLSRTNDREFAVERRKYYQKRVAGEGIEELPDQTNVATPAAVAAVVGSEADSADSDGDQEKDSSEAQPEDMENSDNQNENDSGSQTT
ncbi:MAG: DUF4350 domain-containing protein [Planctomycetota bacterium]